MNAPVTHDLKPALIDRFGRTITYLRVSVTDRCDFRCVYCMAEDQAFLPKREVLSLEELDRRLRRIGCGLSRCDFYAGDHPFDLDYDVPPYGGLGRQHIKLLLGGHVTTSMLLIARRGIGERVSPPIAF